MAKPPKSCDICGKQAQLFEAMVEGVEMNVCRECASFGKMLSAPASFGITKGRFSVEQKQKAPEIVEEIVDDYAIKIKQAREKRRLTQEEFARMLNIHESLLRNIEAGKQKPTIDVARKLEKQLNIILVQKTTEEEAERQQKNPKGSMTIGDMLLMKK